MRVQEFSGQPIDKVTADTDRDFFMSAQEAVEYGKSLRSSGLANMLCIPCPRSGTRTNAEHKASACNNADACHVVAGLIDAVVSKPLGIMP